MYYRDRPGNFVFFAYSSIFLSIERYLTGTTYFLNGMQRVVSAAGSFK